MFYSIYFYLYIGFRLVLMEEGLNNVFLDFTLFFNLLYNNPFNI